MAGRLLAVLLLAVAGITSAHASDEEDFASRYMKLYGENTSLQCVTLSPQMMASAVKVADSVDDVAVREALSHLHSMRVVTLAEPGQADSLHAKALDLIRQNHKRYQPYYGDTGNGRVGIWVRKKDEVILEIILVANEEAGEFSIVDVTGEMDDAFIAKMVEL